MTIQPSCQIAQNQLRRQKLLQKFNQDQNQNIPTLVLYIGEVDESKIAA